MLLIPLVLAWLIGLLLADLFGLTFWHAGGFIGLGSALVAGLWRWRSWRMVGLLLLMLGGGIGRMQLAAVVTTPQSIWNYNERGALNIEGIVSEDPRRTADAQRVLLRVERVATDGRWQAAEGLVLAKLPPYPARTYGDRLLLITELQTPREAERPNQFDYRSYLARRQIFSISEPTAVRLLAQDQASGFWSGLLKVRDQARRVLLRSLPEPQSSLAVGILLGLQSSIPPDVYETFSVTGTSHILVISGWNITIIASALYAAASRLKLSSEAVFWVAIGCIWLYTLFVGASSTVLRAAAMGTIVVIGQRLERPGHAWTTLFAATWLMTVWNPQTLWDLGFQLSALATASLFAYGKGTEALLLRTPLRVSWLDWAREALTATLAAQILALPLILYHFGNLSIIAPLANVVLLPMVPYAMLWGAIALVAGLIWLPLGQLLANVAYLFLTWLTEGTRVFAGLPWAAVQLPPFPLWLLLAYYTIVLGAWLLHQWLEREIALLQLHQQRTMPKKSA
jgi:competence protein ComEC